MRSGKTLKDGDELIAAKNLGEILIIGSAALWAREAGLVRSQRNSGDEGRSTRLNQRECNLVAITKERSRSTLWPPEMFDDINTR